MTYFHPILKNYFFRSFQSLPLHSKDNSPFIKLPSFVSPSPQQLSLLLLPFLLLEYFFYFFIVQDLIQVFEYSF